MAKVPTRVLSPFVNAGAGQNGEAGGQPSGGSGGAEAAMEPGDAVLLYTDGVTKAMDPDNRQYSFAPLQALVARPAPEAGARAVVGGVMADVKTHVRGCAPSDDITIMVVRRSD